MSSKEKLSRVVWALVVGSLTATGSIAAIGWVARGYMAGMDERHASIARQLGEHMAWDVEATAGIREQLVELKARATKTDDKLSACNCRARHGG